MGLFGKDKDEKPDKKERLNEEMRAELARLEALPLPRLAEEILVRGFGPDGLGDDGAPVSITALAKTFNPAGTTVFGIDESVRGRFEPLLMEGLQLLEHARWLTIRLIGSDRTSLGYAITRAGRAALAGGQAARQLPGA
jgi:hypothetical protein